MKVQPHNQENKPEPKQPSIRDYLPEIKLKVDRLPSKGLAYPPGATIKHRPFTFGEIKKISQSRLDTKEKFEFILSGIECSFDKLDLTLPDFMYIGFLRRISTLGTSEGVLIVKCPHCKKDHREKIEVGSSKNHIDFNDIKAEALPVIVELADRREYYFQPITLRKLFELLDGNKEVNDPILLMAAQCSLIKEGKKEYIPDIEEVYKIIENVLPEDGLMLAEVDEYLAHSIKPLKLICKNKLADDQTCGQEMSVELDGGDALLLPFRGDKESTQRRIRFGTKVQHKSGSPK